jgi:PAS domain S-box-containing protein
MDAAIITHDTYRILDANQRALELFRADREDLIDQAVSSGVYGEDMRWLIQLRMMTIREHGELPARMFPFLRQSGSAFWAEVKTRKVGEGVYESTLTYKSEYP